ncbi:MerR family transcriptional regulator [Loigolactobacillus bifermentans]|uniref:Transcription regulator n=1 Tax=Loigolactobacillus bifermentans DSM 20003 TaxID=1423726 RepID=A0A0R1GZ31_9LACO|nr:MerR family transcriptional regulator [Loigolactobacillus bifermentans]KRK39461.1 transcription regulator [Loigolactobacillus bifermentans DSM 20003]QGG61227.1 MerR family transcriptional regulator [Loigolactobacillus bifermentans]
MPYSIGQVATQTGITEYTLRFYDKAGLLPFVKRNAAGRRQFSSADVDFINLISCLKDTGMSLAEIKNFVDMSLAGDVTLPQRLALFKRQQQAVRQQIQDAETRLAKLDHKVRFFQAACDAGSEAAVTGQCVLPVVPAAAETPDHSA